MRRTFAVAAAIGAITAVSMALLVPTGAGAQTTTTSSSTTTTTTPTLIGNLCGTLPGLLDRVGDALPLAETALTTARQTMDTRRAAMTTAMAELATAVVNHLAILDSGGNSTATGNILNGKQAQYVDAVVAWSRSRTQVFDGEQMLIFGQLQQTLLDSVSGAACP